MSVEGASAWRQGFSSAEKRPRQRRPSMGSTPLTFHKTKGKFASGALPTDQPQRLDRLRKDALEDFNKATVERDVSVHQMAALFASNTGSDRGDGGPTASDFGGSEDGDSYGLNGSRTRTNSSSSIRRPNGSVAGSDAGSLHGLGRPMSFSSEASYPDKKDSSPFASREGSRHGEVSRPSTPCGQSKYTSFTNPSATDLRAMDLKQKHRDEARTLASNRSANVKDIANAFNGRSRSENVEVFQKRRAAQEAAYRTKVHEGRETLKKTSQGTDAMYNFVLKLNLATTEGKERFMRRWAVGRLATGEQPTPVEGWKFLESLGIDAASKKDRRATTAPAAKVARELASRFLASRASAAPRTSAASRASAASSCNSSATETSTIGETACLRRPRWENEAEEDQSSQEAPSVARPRGRSPVRAALRKFDGLRAESEGFGNDRRATCAFGDVNKGGDDHEVAAWEAALNRAVGATAKVDTDACAPEIMRARLRRRSGSEPRRPSPKLPQAPETCRPTLSKSFWSDSASVPPPPLTVHARPEDPRDVSLSPAGSPVRFMLPQQMWNEGAHRAIRERPSRSIGTSSDRRMSAQSRRTSDGVSLPNSSPPKGLRLTSVRLSGSPTRFSLSPSQSGSAERPTSGLTRENSLSSCSTEVMITRVPPTSPSGGDWDSSFRQSGSLEPPDSVRERAEKSLSEVSDDDDIGSNLSAHDEISSAASHQVYVDDPPRTRESFDSGAALRNLSVKAFPSDEEIDNVDFGGLDEAGMVACHKVYVEDPPSTRESFASGVALRSFSEPAFPPDEDSDDANSCGDDEISVAVNHRVFVDDPPSSRSIFASGDALRRISQRFFQSDRNLGGSMDLDDNNTATANKDALEEDGETWEIGGEVYVEDPPSTRATFASGDALRRLSERAFPSDEDLESDDEEGHNDDTPEAMEKKKDIFSVELLTDPENAGRKSTIEGGDVAGGEPGGRASNDTVDAMARAQRLSEVRTRMSDPHLSVGGGTLSDGEDHDDTETVGYERVDKDDVMPELATPRSFDQVKDATDRESFCSRTRMDSMVGTATPFTEDEERGRQESSGSPHPFDGSPVEGGLQAHEGEMVTPTRVDGTPQVSCGDVVGSVAEARRVSTSGIDGASADRASGACKDIVGANSDAKESPTSRDEDVSKKHGATIEAAPKVAVVQNPPASGSTHAPGATVTTLAFPVESSHGGSMDLTCKEVLSSEAMSDAASVSVYDADMSMSEAASEQFSGQFSEQFSEQSSEATASEVACDEERESLRSDAAPEVVDDDASVTASTSAVDGDDEASTGVRRASLKELKIAIGDELLPGPGVAPVRKLEWGPQDVEMTMDRDAHVVNSTASRRDEDEAHCKDGVCTAAPTELEEADAFDTAERLGLSDAKPESVCDEAEDGNGDDDDDEGDDDDDDEVSSVIMCGGDEAEITSAEEAGGPSSAADRNESERTSNSLGARGLEQAKKYFTMGNGVVGGGGFRGVRGVRGGSMSDLSSLIALAANVPPPLGDADRSPTKTGEKLVGRSHRRQRSLLPNEFSDDSHPRPPEKVEMTIMSPARRASLIQSPRRSIAIFGSPDNAMRLAMARKGMLGADQGGWIAGAGQGNAVRSPRSPRCYSFGLDQIAESAEDGTRPDARGARADASVRLVSAPSRISGGSEEARDVSDDGGEVSSDTDGALESGEEVDESTEEEEGAVETESVVDEADRAGASSSCKGVGVSLEEADQAQKKISVPGGDGEDVTMEVLSKEVGNSKAELMRDRCMTEQTEDTVSPESRRVASSTNSENPSPSNGGSGVGAPASEGVERNSGGEEKNKPGRCLDTCQESVGGDVKLYAEPSASASASAAPPSTPLPRTSSESRPEAVGTPALSPAGSPEVMMGPSPDRLPGDNGDECGEHGAGAGLGGVGSGKEEEKGESKVSVASVAKVDASPLRAGVDAGAEISREASYARTGHERLEAVDSVNPYEDFDALHDRQYMANTKPNCAGAFDFLAFCRPRPVALNNNPSTKGSGIGFFRLDSVASTTGTVELDRPTPRGGLLGFCTPGSRVPSATTSTRGHRPRFFSLLDDGTAKTELECQTPGSALGSCNARALGQGPQSTKGRGFGFSPVKLAEEDLAETKSETEADEAESEGKGADKEVDSRPSVGKHAGNGFKQFLGERVGLECSIS